MINYRLKIDFSDSKTLASDICFVSGDVKSSTLYFDFFDEGKRVDISGYTLSIRAKRSDGVVIASSGKIENNTAIFTPESNFYAVPGELYIEIALSDATGKYATTKVIIAEVIEGLGEAAIEGSDKLNVYVTLINEAVAAKDKAKAAASAAEMSADASNYAAQRAEVAAAEALENAGGAVFANALKAGASGEIIRIDDVSPVEHTIKAKVSNEDLESFVPENIKLQVFGKNLIPYPFPYIYVSNNELSVSDIGDGGVRLNGNVTKQTYVMFAKFWLGNSMITGVGTGAGGKFSSNRYNEQIKTVYDPADQQLYLSVSPGTVCDNIEFYPQIEIGSKITEYEKGLPYRSFIPNTDGLVEFSSVSPTMSLIADTKGVVIDVEYNQDSNAVIKELSEHVDADIQKLDEKVDEIILSGGGGTADASNYYTKTEVDNKIGDINTALDNLIALQESYIGGVE